jgi:ribosome modulation factor
VKSTTENAASDLNEWGLAKDQGHSAGYRGDCLSDNPHTKPDSAKRLAWIEGWENSQIEKSVL